MSFTVSATAPLDAMSPAPPAPCTKETPRCAFTTWGPHALRPACCTAHLQELLFFIHDLFVQQGIFHWVDFGTLLGAVRNESFIAWDPDVDLCFLHQDIPTLLQLEAVIQQQGYQLIRDRRYPALFRLCYSPINQLHVDLWAYRNEQGTMKLEFAQRPERWSFPAHYLQTLEMVTLYGRCLPAPSPVHPFLQEQRYGATYLIPLRFNHFAHQLAPAELTPLVVTLLNEWHEYEGQLRSYQQPATATEPNGQHTVARRVQHPNKLANVLKVYYLQGSLWRKLIAHSLWRYGLWSGEVQRFAQQAGQPLGEVTELTPVAYLLLCDIAAQKRQLAQLQVRKEVMTDE